MREDRRTAGAIPLSENSPRDPGPAAIDPYRLSLLLESSSPVMLRAVATARNVAPFAMPVLLTGETGTGKRVLAAAIHDWSPRRAGPFVTVSGRAPEKLRREPGEPHADAATAPYDDERWAPSVPDGTLFLDDVGMLSGVAQAKLIRFLDEDRSADPRAEQTPTAWTRVIAATGRDLESDVQAGRFRHELFFRLNVVTIHLPPLRERREDLPRLTASILATMCHRHRRPSLELAPQVRAALAAHDWRGNLRELEMVLEHAIVLARTDMIQLGDLPERVLGARS